MVWGRLLQCSVQGECHLNEMSHPSSSPAFHPPGMVVFPLWPESDCLFRSVWFVVCKYSKTPTLQHLSIPRRLVPLKKTTRNWNTLSLPFSLILSLPPSLSLYVSLNLSLSYTHTHPQHRWTLNPWDEQGQSNLCLKIFISCKLLQNLGKHLSVRQVQVQYHFGYMTCSTNKLCAPQTCRALPLY